jgi:hypothetical protein
VSRRLEVKSKSGVPPLFIVESGGTPLLLYALFKSN